MSRAERIGELSVKLTKVAKGIKVLTAIGWGPTVAEEFLESWRRGAPKAPSPQVPPPINPSVASTLDDIRAACDSADPISKYLGDTALSYRRAIDLVSQVGTKGFYDISREIYGSAGGPLRGSTMCHRDAAERLLASTAAMAHLVPDSNYCVTAQTVAAQLARDWKGFFDKPLSIVIDDDLSAKAAASAKRIRLRGGTCYTEEDAAQLSAHEIGVHSLTARNGASQKVLCALSLGAPRTTATQEGLATFAELVTGTIDLARLRRLALRIRAISMVEDGADFVQLFQHLLAEGESELEATYTTMRVFRGADPAGRYPFTKDVVYLKGLFAVHTFLRKAISDQRPELIRRLFIGRVTLGDVLAFDRDMGGLIEDARYVPPWAAKLPSLAAYLSFSALMDVVDLGSVESTRRGPSIRAEKSATPAEAGSTRWERTSMLPGPPGPFSDLDTLDDAEEE